MYRAVFKRAFDLALVATTAVIWAPLLLAVAAVVRAWIGSPVFFRQRRPGLGGHPFTILKFRTMTDGRDASGALLPDAARLTRAGRLLRSSSLDELPELLNVLRGEMSLVGPRPLLMQYLERYSREQARRHEVRPGLTGWAQVNGRNSSSWDDRLGMDVWYVDHVSLELDLKILWRTLTAVLDRRGISAEGHATMPEFQGRGTDTRGTQ